MNEMVIIGKTVSTHGIKGELKVISDFEYIQSINPLLRLSSIVYLIVFIFPRHNFLPPECIFSLSVIFYHTKCTKSASKPKKKFIS